MARSEARIEVDIWDDADFVALCVTAQWAYLMLLFQPDLSAASVLPLRPTRWARLAADVTAADIEAALKDLARSGFAWVDDAAQEVLVRPQVRPRGPRHLQAALQASLGIHSEALRARAIALLVDVHVSRKATRSAAIRLTVHSRDGYTCRHCDWAVQPPDGYDGTFALSTVDYDPAKNRYRLRVLELDHVYPAALGGKFEVPNLQTLCTGCNVRKGATV